MSYPNFRAGLQLSDNNLSQVGNVEYTDYLDTNSQNISEWAMDSNQTDPDAAKIYLEVEQIDTLTGLDFRVGIAASDNAATNQFGAVQFTPWASEGGSWSGWASDANGYDPDAYRLFIETRPWNSPKILKDFRLGIQLSDNNNSGTGLASYTPWALSGGGTSSWATDSNAYDPDSIRIDLGIRFEANGSQGGTGGIGGGIGGIGWGGWQQIP